MFEKYTNDQRKEIINFAFCSFFAVIQVCGRAPDPKLIFFLFFLRKMLFTRFYKLEISTRATKLEALAQIPAVKISV